MLWCRVCMLCLIVCSRLAGGFLPVGSAVGADALLRRLCSNTAHYGEEASTPTYGWSLLEASGNYLIKWCRLSLSLLLQTVLQLALWIICWAARRRLISYYPVESVTFKMACSQGSLPVIRDMHYGLWSHPVNICIDVCVCARARFCVSWRSVWTCWKLFGSLTWIHVSFFFSF